MSPGLEEWEERLPDAPTPVANYVTYRQSGRLVFTSGVVPISEGKPLLVGRLGEKVSVEEGYQAAREAALAALSIVRESLGTLARVARIVQLVVYVASAPGFTAQSKVADGASDLLVEVFGEEGRPTRSAVGVASLPLGVPVELSLVAESKPEPAHQKG